MPPFGLTAPIWYGCAAATSAAITIAGLRVRALSRSGAVAAFCVGLAILGCGGLAAAAALLVFFASGSILSRLAGPRAADARAIAHRGSTRDAVQVLCNGGVAAVAAIAAGIASGAAQASSERWVAAAVGALSVAAADTWATEIGIRSTERVRSILTLRVVNPGVSGGVTLLGCAASIVGGAAIGLAAAPFAPHFAWWRWLVSCALIGVAGSALDSLLGATVQGAWYCDACARPAEWPAHGCGARTRLTGGLGWIDNDAVNALSTLAGAALGWLIFPYMG